jgi:alpha-tubulin suppressor-like RCC1 family protein
MRPAVQIRRNWTRAVRAIVACVAGACVDPVMPGAGVPTLDDAGSDSFVAVTVGRLHSCALRANGAAYCWGSNEFGQLGTASGTTVCLQVDRSVPCEATPRPVLGGLTFTRLSAGANHTCGIAVDARVYCWGSNERGQLGEPSVPQGDAPTLIASGAQFVDVAAGDEHTCAVRSDNVALCWGANSYGQLGVGSAGSGFSVPTLVQTAQRFASISAGAQRTCGRTAGNTSYCWGAHWFTRADNGQEVFTSQQAPSQVGAAPQFHAISVGGATCGLTVLGVAHCWESNPTGALGDGSRVGSQTPRLVETGERFISLSAGASHTCGISDVGAAWCWGADSTNQLGVPPSRISRRCGAEDVRCALSPMKVSGWRVFSSVSTGLGGHSCGITLPRNVYCWGAGSMGQLGVGSATSSWSPTRVAAP